MKSIELLFSDVSFGTQEYGFIPRGSNQDPDDEDLRYGRYLKKNFGIVARVAGGKVRIQLG